MNSCGEYAHVVPKSINEFFIDFNKSGIVVAKNPISFGREAWEIILHLQSAHSVDNSSVVKLGKNTFILINSLN